ncbi:MAG: hypothetical protein PQJ60_04090, partial [Spirochaetales bacterium]|nr:hypothetical protein [Spirochaetales bacterium]
KAFLFFTAVLVFSSLALFAEEEDEIDMSNPVDPYTKIGVGYGTAGLDISTMVVFGKSTTSKSGIIFNVNDVFSQEDDKSINYRLRIGQISTVNGIGLSIDAINAYHSELFGRITILQTGVNASLPIGEKLMIFPVLYTGPVIVENSTEDLYADLIDNTSGLTGYSYSDLENYNSSGGYDIASVVGTAMLYVSFNITDRFWSVGSVSYTNSYWGKSYTDDVSDGGLQVDPLCMDLTVGFQIKPNQNVTAYWSYVDDDNDQFALSYNYAF